jgi:hypothetical protein
MTAVQPPPQEGWLVIDPAGYPCAWYGPALARDDTAAFELFEPARARRAKLAAAGWTTRPGCGAELVSGAADVRASA